MDGNSGLILKTNLLFTFYIGMTPEQRSVMEPPYALRLERQQLGDDLRLTKSQRSQEKREFDLCVFGTEYY